MENSKQPAFACSVWNGVDGNKEYKGLTKREYFAGLAMQGLISGRPLDLSKEEANVIGSQAIQFADELLKQLEK